MSKGSKLGLRRNLSVRQVLENKEYMEPENILARLELSLGKHPGASTRSIEADDLEWVIRLTKSWYNL